uniref:SET domain-containing protein n=1 Tax=Piliocolobus tephrosceles TaxID=591936 RepID=A0A8C9H4X6_9PRIM
MNNDIKESTKRIENKRNEKIIISDVPLYEDHAWNNNEDKKKCSYFNMYINNMLKSIMNKEKKSQLNAHVTSIKRIEAFYKRNYKIFIINDHNKDILFNKKKSSRDDNNLYVLLDSYVKGDNEVENRTGEEEDEGKHEYKDEEKDQEIKRYNNLFNQFEQVLLMWAVKLNGINKENKCYLHQTEINNNINMEYLKETGKNKDRYGDPCTNIISYKKNYYKGETQSNELNGECDPTEVSNKNGTNEVSGKNEPNEVSNKNGTNEPPDAIFQVRNSKYIQFLKEGDHIYILFDEDSYDEIIVLQKKRIIQILIYLLSIQKIIKLIDISTYAPPLLWNIILHFREDVYNIELCLNRIRAKYFSINSNKWFCNDYDIQHTHSEFNNKNKNSTNGLKNSCNKEFKKIIEQMEITDSVYFLDNFLQCINKKKLKQIKKVQSLKSYKKYEYDRKINQLNKNELINLFIDKKNEINILPLYYLNEKNRNIIYEENMKMNMFACIKIVLDEIKGRCIYAVSNIHKFDFVFEYIGKLLTHEQALKQERKYIKTEQGCYMFYFKYQNKKYCIDSTDENIEAAINNQNKKHFLRSFARLVNHSKKKANLIAKVLPVYGIPRLFFVASRNIEAGEELLIDYGERDKDIIKDNQWLKC